MYGKDISQIILDNCGLVYLKTNTQETAEAISKRLGHSDSSVTMEIYTHSFESSKKACADKFDEMMKDI